MSKGRRPAPPARSQSPSLPPLHKPTRPLKQRQHPLRLNWHDRAVAAGGSARGRRSSENKPSGWPSRRKPAKLLASKNGAVRLCRSLRAEGEDSVQISPADHGGGRAHGSEDAEEARCSQRPFGQESLLPLGDVLGYLKEAILNLSRSTPHRKPAAPERPQASGGGGKDHKTHKLGYAHELRHAAQSAHLLAGLIPATIAKRKGANFFA
jgi:hypothetical protein